jgi:hypothetical protein
MARGKSTQSEAAIVRAPADFRDLGSVTAECWFNLEPGNVVQGTLLGMYEMKDDRSSKPGAMKNFFQILVTEPGAKGRYGKGEDAEVKEIPVGATINLNYGVKTKVLETLLPSIQNNAKHAVWVHCGDKIKVGKGQTMWVITCKSKMLRAPTAAPEPDFSDVEPVATSGDDSGAELE